MTTPITTGSTHRYEVRAHPRRSHLMTSQDIEDARWLKLMGFTLRNIAAHCGVSATTLRCNLDYRARAKQRYRDSLPQVRQRRKELQDIRRRTDPDYHYKRKLRRCQLPQTVLAVNPGQVAAASRPSGV